MIPENLNGTRGGETGEQLSSAIAGTHVPHVVFTVPPSDGVQITRLEMWDAAEGGEPRAWVRADEADQLRTWLREALDGWRSEIGPVFVCDDDPCEECDRKVPQAARVRRIAAIRKAAGL